MNDLAVSTSIKQTEWNIYLNSNKKIENCQQDSARGHDDHNVHIDKIVFFVLIYS